MKTLFEKLLGKFKEEWEKEKATEITIARRRIIEVLKEEGISLPGCCFALDLVKAELVRAQLEEFLGNVKLGEDLPLSEKNPENVEI